MMSFYNTLTIHRQNVKRRFAPRIRHRLRKVDGFLDRIYLDTSRVGQAAHGLLPCPVPAFRPLDLDSHYRRGPWGLLHFWSFAANHY